eukprot:CAMPEP_0174929540 /NCGR_PEP_ID=MMETSP1355-20121228/27547_1 /TAXON_ID=464990 /ORGANISM="Hemiselmis tepida, Strain CCMP443" /LENGTH=126 /DNA_ID=CAMNT_0016175753 /DNA_START=192 /DNA_END=569 /DNA_ORIENTATION=-
MAQASAPDFAGDRGKNNLAHNNERELVPYFLEDPVGNQVVNDNHLLPNPAAQPKPKQGKGKKAANIAAAKANVATAVRPFAVQQRAAPPQPQPPIIAAAPAAAKAKQQGGKFAGGAFLNSPPPSSL